jgi:hypothetical protein
MLNREELKKYEDTGINKGYHYQWCLHRYFEKNTVVLTKGERKEVREKFNITDDRLDEILEKAKEKKSERRKNSFVYANTFREGVSPKEFRRHMLDEES